MPDQHDNNVFGCKYLEMQKLACLTLSINWNRTKQYCTRECHILVTILKRSYRKNYMHWQIIDIIIVVRRMFDDFDKKCRSDSDVHLGVTLYLCPTACKWVKLYNIQHIFCTCDVVSSFFLSRCRHRTVGCRHRILYT